MTYHTILYTRKSSEEDDRQALSLDAQERECQRFAVSAQFACDEIIRESHSARRPGRPLFNAMLQTARHVTARGQRVRILCHKPDRLLRNIGDWARINDLVDSGVELLFVSGSYPNNAQGKMAFGINVLFAKYYVDNLSEEVRKGIREKLARGEWPCLAPLGYKNVREGGRPIVVPHPDKAPLILDAFELYARGEHSLEAVSTELARLGLLDKGGKPLRKGYLAGRILSNPFYHGLMAYDGHTYEGRHEPLVSLDLFERVQAVLRSKSRPRAIRHDFPFRGLLRCGACGCAIVAEIKKDRYVYYHCTRARGPCLAPYVRQEQVHRSLRVAVRSALGVASLATESLTEAGRRIASLYVSEAPAARTGLQRRLLDLDKKLTILLDLRLVGDLSDQEYRDKRASILTDKVRLKEQLDSLERDAAEDPEEILTRFCAFLRNLTSAVEAASAPMLRELTEIVGSNFQLWGQLITFEPVEPFTFAPHVQERQQWSATADDVRNFLARVQVASPRIEHFLNRVRTAGPDSDDEPESPHGPRQLAQAKAARASEPALPTCGLPESTAHR